MGDLLFHGIKPENELFITGHPVNDRVRHVLKVFGFLLAHFNICLSLLLQPQGELSTPCDALSAELKALVCLFEWLCFRVVETVHAAACRFVIHDVELLIKEGEEPDLSVFHALIQVLKDLLIHVSDSVFVVLFAELEEVSQFLLALGLWIEVHVELLLEVLPCSRILGLFAMKGVPIEVEAGV